MRNTTWLVCWIAVAAGCTPPPAPPTIIDIRGKVQIDGVPLKTAEVRFMPVSDADAAYIARGVTDEFGNFTLTCQGQSGACLGENRVLIAEAEFPSHLMGERAQPALAKYLQGLGNRPLPPRYANLVETPLKVMVRPDQAEYLIKLTSK